MQPPADSHWLSPRSARRYTLGSAEHPPQDIQFPHPQQESPTVRHSNSLQAQGISPNQRQLSGSLDRQLSLQSPNQHQQPGSQNRRLSLDSPGRQPLSGSPTRQLFPQSQQQEEAYRHNLGPVRPDSTTYSTPASHPWRGYVLGDGGNVPEHHDPQNDDEDLVW